jgi:hypothetical protein
MKKRIIIIPVLVTVLIIPSLLLAVERAPRISDLTQHPNKCY